MIEINLQELKRKLDRGKHAGSLQHWKGKPLPKPEIPPAIMLERRAKLEAQQIMQTAGAGALFSVYSQLAERYGSLIVLLPVAQQVANQNIAKVLQTMQLTVTNNGKIYCLPWIFCAKQSELAQSFQDNAEKAIQDIREMLVYALHLCQLAGKEMLRERKYYFGEEWERIRAKRGISDAVNNKLVTAKSKTLSNSNADKLIVEPARVYDYITSTFAREIADSAGAWQEHQRWTRELLLSQQQDDHADSGGGISISTGR